MHYGYKVVNAAAVHNRSCCGFLAYHVVHMCSAVLCVDMNLRYKEGQSSSPHPDVNLPGLCLQVTVELKNDLAINGTLHSVYQYPHMVSSSTQQHGLILRWC
jgi:hypothetical protein